MPLSLFRKAKFKYLNLVDKHVLSLEETVNGIIQ